jgi:hypothetical protein
VNKSEQIDQLVIALNQAQGRLKNPHFDSVNPHFKSKFASLGAIRAEVIPVFQAVGLTLSQWPITEGHASGCRTLLAHVSGQWLEECFLIPVDKPNAHGHASAVTYAKRISMQSVAGIVGDDDDDGNCAVGNPAPAEKKVSGITPTGGVWDALPEDMKVYLTDVANDVRTLLYRQDIAGAWDELTSHDADIDENAKVGLWSRFDSKERSALKKESERRKQKEAA